MKKSEALKILGLQDGASDEDIKKAHRKLVIENHPDRFGQDENARAEAEEKTKLINEARDVLLSRKWTPEYSTAGTPYGAPFNYQGAPRGGSGGTGRPGGQGHDPFAGWPFDMGSFVWTTWDAQGNPHTYQSPGGSGQGPFGGNPFGADPFTKKSSDDPFSTSNPFTGSIPFGFSPFAQTQTPEQQLKKEKKSLISDLQLIGIKAILLALCCAFSVPALGFYLYTVISVVQGVYKRLSILSIFLAAPLLLLAFVFMPVANGPVGFLALAIFVIAVGFDVNNLIQHYRLISTLRQKVTNKDKVEN